jgi:hypothetical protein
VDLENQELQTIMLTNDARVTYHTKDKNTQKEALHEIKLQYDGTNKPKILEQNLIVESNKINYYSTNDNGTIVFNSAHESNIHLQSIYLYKDKETTTFLKKDDKLELEEKDFFVAGYFGDMEIDNNDKLLLVCGYEHEQMTQPSRTILHMDILNYSKDNNRYLFGTYENILASQKVIHGIGLIDKSPNQDIYVSQLFINNPPYHNGTMGDNEPHEGAIVSGYTFEQGIANHIILPKSMQNSASYTTNTMSGTGLFGPRVNDLAHTALVMKDEDELYTLYKNNEKVAQETEKTPLKNTIDSFFGYIPAQSGLLFYQVYTDTKEDELCVYDGVLSKTILTTNAAIEDKIGAPIITDIRFGAARNCVDYDNKIVLIASFSDNTQSVLIGIPT